MDLHPSCADGIHYLARTVLFTESCQNGSPGILRVSSPAYVILPLRYIGRIPSLTAGNDVHSDPLPVKASWLTVTDSGITIRSGGDNVNVD